MNNESRPALGPKRFREIVYATDTILDIKKNIHERYSSVPIQLNHEIYGRADLKRGAQTLLDIGCGTGDFLLHVRKTEGHIGTLIGADLASGVYKKNQQLSNEQNLCINFLEASVLKLPMPDKSVDVVAALHMLSHVPLDEANREIVRVLKKDGKLIATANSLNSYPHVDKYRKLAFEMMGWGEPVFTSSSFNLENMEMKLQSYWTSVQVVKLQGELRIPIRKFLKYFYANMVIWDPMPTEKESEAILEMVSKQLKQDAQEGFVIEPKYAGIAICKKIKVL